MTSAEIRTGTLRGREEVDQRLQARGQRRVRGAGGSIGPMTRSPRPWCVTRPGSGIAVAT